MIKISFLLGREKSKTKTNQGMKKIISINKKKSLLYQHYCDSYIHFHVKPVTLVMEFEYNMSKIIVLDTWGYTIIIMKGIQKRRALQKIYSEIYRNKTCQLRNSNCLKLLKGKSQLCLSFLLTKIKLIFYLNTCLNVCLNSNVQKIIFLVMAKVQN